MKKILTLVFVITVVFSFTSRAQQNVGIGTTNPLQKLEIGGTSNTLRIDGIGTGGSFLTAPVASSTLLYANSLGDVSSIPPGSPGNVITINGSGLIQWLAPTTLSAGTGINIVGNSINSLWTATGNNIYNNNNSGAGGVGIATNGAPNTTLDVNGSVAFRQGTALALSSGTNSNIALGSNSFFRITGPTGAFTITGLAGGADGRIVTLYNTTAFAMTIVNNATSTAANEILTNTGANIVTPAGNSVVQLQYNATASRWVVLGGSNLSPTAWSVTGNSGLTSDFASPLSSNGNFIGNTDNIPLAFRVNNVRAGLVDNSASASTFLGYQAGNYGVYGTFGSGPASYQNVYVGYEAGTTNGSASAEANDNVGIGYFADANSSTGAYNTSVGAQAFEYGTGTKNVAIGYNALAGPSTFLGGPGLGTQNTAVGYGALAAVNEASNSVGNNTALGYSAGAAATSAVNNVFVGSSAGSGVTTSAATNNVFLGTSAGATGTSITTGSQNTFLGASTGSNGAAYSNSTAIGYNTAITSSNQIVLGNSSVSVTEFNGALMPSTGTNTYSAGTSGQVLISKGPGVAPQWGTAPAWSLTGNASTINDNQGAGNFVGTTDNNPLSFRVNNSRGGYIDNTTNNLFLGYKAGSYGGSLNSFTMVFTMNATQNVYLGSLAGSSNGSASSAASNNVGIGYLADDLNTAGSQNTVIGASTMQYNTGSGNVSLGYQALRGPAFSSGNSTNNVAIGLNALYSVNETTAGTGNNVAVGANVGGNAFVGTYNIFLGANAAPNITSGSRNVLIGNGAGTTALGGTNSATLSDHLVIESTQSTAAWASGAAPNLLSGNFAAATIGLEHAVTHDAEFGTTSFNGHLDVQAGMTGTGAAQGTNNMLASTATFSTFTDGSVTVANNSTDVSGTVSVVVNTATGTGSATFTFGHAYTTAPFITLTPANANAASGVNYWVTSTTTGFTINFTGAASTTYAFNYFAVETTK